MQSQVDDVIDRLKEYDLSKEIEEEYDLEEGVLIPRQYFLCVRAPLPTF